MFYFWLGIVIFLGIFEAITINLVSIWFVISGLVSLVLSFVIDSFVVQFAVFVVLGVILMLLTRKTLQEKLVKTNVKTNFDRIVGMKGVVTEKIDELVVGEVKVDGKKWSAVSSEKIDVGETVKVLNIKGVKLEVERWEE